MPPCVSTISALRAQHHAWRAGGLRIGFVPTMGALHAGHLSLVRLLKARLDRVTASIFVNPKQFAPHEDLESYPRDLAGDCQKLADAGCDLIFTPERDTMYPSDFATSVLVSGVSEGLESSIRPHFFGGVATIVTKLLLQSLPDAAAFGEKDYQQLLVVRALVRDLDVPVDILAGETVREADGLAMSSRNAYLSPAQRAIAPALYATLSRCAARIAAGEPLAPVLADGETTLRAAGFDGVEYLAARGAEDLAILPGPALDRPGRLLVAVKLGKTRLIDNVRIDLV